MGEWRGDRRASTISVAFAVMVAGPGEDDDGGENSGYDGQNKSQDGVGNDWVGRTSAPLALLLLAFLVRGSGVNSRKPIRKNLKGEIYIFLGLAFAWQGLVGLDRSGKWQMEKRSKT